MRSRPMPTRKTLRLTSIAVMPSPSPMGLTFTSAKFNHRPMSTSSWLHELKLIVDLMYEGGISWMRYSVSDTAQVGDITRGRRVITQETREAMKKLLAEIQSGEFARDWIMENKANRPVFNALTKRDAEHPIEVVGQRLRQMMSWLRKEGI